MSPFIPPQDVHYPGDHTALLDRFGASAFERQCDLLDLIHGLSWDADLQSGVITFGDKIRAEFQLIGSFAKEDQSWMWSWANEGSEHPTALLLQSQRMKEIGESNGIPHFTTPLFDAAELVGHMLALIASGMFGADGYYPASYGQGILFVTLSSPQIEEFIASRKHIISLVFSQFISAFPVNHRKAFGHYLSAKGFDLEENGNRIVASRSSEEIVAEFDASDRLVSVGGNLAAQPPKKKKWWFF
jgi:hypothetical protein